MFIRDVETGDVIDDPTGWKAIGATTLNGEQWPRRSWSVGTTASGTTTPAAYSLPTSQRDYFTPTPLSIEPEPITDMTPRPMTPASATNARFPVTPTSGRFPGTSSSASIRSSNTGASVTSSMQRVIEAERKRNDLQLRVWRARTQMPGHIPLRIFRSPGECVEAEEILVKEHL